MRTLVTIALAATALGAPAQAERIFGLTADNNIVTFDSATPGVFTTSGAISGLVSGDVLTGLDLRPANRQLYSVSTSGRVYVINKDASGSGYTATSLGTLTGGELPDASPSFGIDFNPVPDRIRHISSGGQNLRLNQTVSPPVSITDGDINGPLPISIVGAAYTNSRPGVTMTTLFALDADGNQLLQSTNPNAGTYIEIGTLAVATLTPMNLVGFDISGATGDAFFNVDSTFYGLNLANAGTTVIGTLDTALVGITAGAVPEPATWALMIAGFGLVGTAARRRSRTAIAA